MSGEIITAVVASIVMIVLIIYSLIQMKEKSLSSPKSWSRFKLPLTLKLHEDFVILPELVEAIENAINFWNETVSILLFVPLDSTAPGETVVLEPATSANYISTNLSWDNDGLIQRASVFIPMDLAAEMDQTSLDRAIARELGHVLGLEDDNFTNSVMFNKVLAREPQLTEKDKVLLHLFYGNSEEHDGGTI